MIILKKKPQIFVFQNKSINIYIWFFFPQSTSQNKSIDIYIWFFFPQHWQQHKKWYLSSWAWGSAQPELDMSLEKVLGAFDSPLWMAHCFFVQPLERPPCHPFVGIKMGLYTLKEYINLNLPPNVFQNGTLDPSLNDALNPKKQNNFLFAQTLHCLQGLNVDILILHKNFIYRDGGQVWVTDICFLAKMRTKGANRYSLCKKICWLNPVDNCWA